MRALVDRLPGFAAALWWGSLTAVGFVVVPLLFMHLPSASLAGQTAARLFTAQTWISVGCGMALSVFSRSNRPSAQATPAQAAIIFVFAGLLLALLAEFAVAPRIMAREHLRWWHGVGSGMYLLQWACAGTILWRLTGTTPAGTTCSMQDAVLEADKPDRPER